MSTHHPRTIRLAITVTTLVLLLTTAAPAFATAPQGVTRGTFDTFADGAILGYDLDGHATMVRTPHRTIVRVQVVGLTPGERYPSHVHAQSCDDNNAGGHYAFPAPVAGGAHDDGDEIWPGPLDANAAGNAHGGSVVGAVAGPDAVSVVIHAPSGQKIACADLR